MMKLNKETFNDGIGVIVQVANKDILDDINSLAKVISEEGDNSMKGSLLEGCKKYQNVYNSSFKPGIDKVIKTFGQFYDLTEAMEKATVGDLSTTDASFSVKGIDPDAVNV